MEIVKPFLIRYSDVWSFVLKMNAANAVYRSVHEKLTAESRLSKSNWVIVGAERSGVVAHMESTYKFDYSDLRFLITEVLTKGGVLLKTPEDIYEFFQELSV